MNPIGDMQILVRRVFCMMEKDFDKSLLLAFCHCLKTFRSVCGLLSAFLSLVVISQPAGDYDETYGRAWLSNIWIRCLLEGTFLEFEYVPHSFSSTCYGLENSESMVVKFSSFLPVQLETGSGCVCLL